jgi:uncharacterized membrane protein
MANSKARSGRRPAPGGGGNRNTGATTRSARTIAAVSATPTSRKVVRPAADAFDPDEPAQDMHSEPEPGRRPGPPLWLQLVSFALAVLGLAISAYETWAHYNGSHLLGCPSKGAGTFDCTAVITSSQSMVFNIFPVAVLGLAFYVFAVVIFTPWAWRLTAIRLGPLRITARGVDIVRLGSVIVGMGFVMYLIYAEFQIGEVCEYCSGVHVVTFLLFCITVVSAALWGLGQRNPSTARP